MVLFGLLVVPILIGLAGLLLGKGLITWKELIAQEFVVVLFIVVGYLIALHAQTSDTEIWNGVIASKTAGRERCCHTYSCDCHQVCSGSGKDRHCHQECDTCYHHGGRKTGWDGDLTWDASSSNGEHVYHDGCNSPGSSPPARWNAIVVGEPTAVEHSYTNYIKGNPDTILRRSGARERFASRIPAYPEVYDYYRADRFLAVGVGVPELRRMNARLSEINATLGAPKQVNVTVIVVNEGDQAYLEGLREAWLGGKKNDLVVVIGAPDFPRIAWAGVMSWTRNEEVKLAIRDRIAGMETFDGDAVLGIVAEEVRAKFVRRPMADFEYLRSTIEPPSWACWLLFILGCLASLGLTWYFWVADPFGDGSPRYGSGFGRRPW
ncbi:MAG TPA: hypothetical protein VL500_07165 [Candidatus Eisenbacteria bacterium]|nr:hypothetical protein [Candidatus Eisenbacteria bacterium]